MNQVYLCLYFICILLYIISTFILLLYDPVFEQLVSEPKVYLVDKLAGKEGSWFKWEQWRKMESLGLRNLTTIMEDENEGLSI